jgi:hypothetical protein
MTCVINRPASAEISAIAEKFDLVDAYSDAPGSRIGEYVGIVNGVQVSCIVYDRDPAVICARSGRLLAAPGKSVPKTGKFFPTWSSTMQSEVKEKFKKGTRVWVRAFGLGTVIDDYWRRRDRFRVSLDRGGDYDFGEAVMTEIIPSALCSKEGLADV